MKTYYFIDEKLHEIARNEINNNYPSDKAEGIIKRLENMHLDPEEMDFDDLHELFQADEDISTLSESGQIIYFLQKQDDLDFSKSDFEKLSGLLEQNPKHELYRLIWINYNVNVFSDEEHFFKQISDFLEEVFSKQGKLINLLDDFFSVTDIDMLLFSALWKKETYDLLIPVLEKAIQQYPEKIILKYILGRIFIEKDDYQVGMAILHEVREYCNARWASFDENLFDGYDFYNYLDMLQTLAIVYDKKGDDKMVNNYTNYIIENVPVLYGPEDDDKGIEDILGYLDTYLLRMRLDMKEGDKTGFITNYKKVEEYFKCDDIKENYNDLVSYVKEIIQIKN